MVNKNVFEKEQGAPEKVTSKPIFFGSHDYFVKNVLPDNIQARLRRISAPTPYVNNRDEVFLLVRSGTGTMAVNGLEYRLKPNTLINLGPFHRYRFIPDKGTALEIADSRMNSGTYVYMIANPYLKRKQFFVTSEPPVVHLTGLLAEMETKSEDRMQLCFCYMMDLFGIITDKMPRSYFSKADSGND